MAVYLSNPKNHVERTNQYYDAVTGLYLQFYGEHFHMCFQQPGESRDAAMDRFNALILDDARLAPGSHLVDIGGGVGGLSRLAVRETGCRATCINISDHQLAIGRKMSRKAGIDVRYENQDAMTFALDAPQDAALMIGVDGHVPDKRKLLKNIARNLRSGARLVMATWLQREDTSPLERAFFLPEFMRCLGFSDVSTFATYRKLFDELGYRIVKFEDRTPDMAYYVEALYRDQLATARSGISLEQMIRAIANPALLKAAVKGEMKAAVDDGFRGVLYLKLCYDAGIFKYGYFVVEAP